MMLGQLGSFVLFTAFVAVYAAWRLRGINRETPDGYFLGGRSLTGVVIAGSLLLTNISTEHLIGMNGSSYRNGAIIITWEATSAIALVIAALYFMPRYLKMGLTTIPEFLEMRFDGMIRSMVAFLLVISMVLTLLPIVLYTGALNIESIFEVSSILNVSKKTGIWITVLLVGGLGSIYAVLGGLKLVALTDTINGIGLLAAGLMIPAIALYHIGDKNIVLGWQKLIAHAPEKFNVISAEPSVGPGSREAILPFSVLFTGIIINQVYFWTMHQSIIQRALGAVNLAEAQKGLLLTGFLKLLMPLIIVLPGIIGFYYYGDTLYDDQDAIYPMLVKKLVPTWLTGFFAAVIVGAVLSTFNSALNSAATVFSLDFYKRIVGSGVSNESLVRFGRNTSLTLAIMAIIIAPYVAYAPEGLYQLLQQLNGIFFVPIATVIIAGFFFPKVSAMGAKAGLIFGLSFYVFLNFVFRVEMHFVHIWGLEFVLNVLFMHVVSHFYPQMSKFAITDIGIVDVKPWKYVVHSSVVLVVLTLGLYIYFGNM